MHIHRAHYLKVIYSIMTIQMSCDGELLPCSCDEIPAYCLTHGALAGKSCWCFSKFLRLQPASLNGKRSQYLNDQDICAKSCCSLRPHWSPFCFYYWVETVIAAGTSIQKTADITVGCILVDRFIADISSAQWKVTDGDTDDNWADDSNLCCFPTQNHSKLSGQWQKDLQAKIKLNMITPYKYLPSGSGTVTSEDWIQFVIAILNLLRFLLVSPYFSCKQRFDKAFLPCIYLNI